jgi:hypothetical protein
MTELITSLTFTGKEFNPWSRRIRAAQSLHKPSYITDREYILLPCALLCYL